MTPSQRTLALALVLGACFSYAGSPHSQTTKLATQFIARTEAQAVHVATQLETRAANLLAICTPHFGGCDTLPSVLERLGIPAELVRESQ